MANEYDNQADGENPADDESDKDLLKEGDELFKEARDGIQKNHDRGREDLRFGRLGEQWDITLKTQREQENRPCLTLNHLPAFIRQVVNSCRENKPGVKVSPVDSGADLKTAKVIAGLFRNIERESSADIAYDTAVEGAASNGFGYIRVNLCYAHDDTFDQDIRIERVTNPFSVYPDPYSDSADGSDYDNCFLAEVYSKRAFKARWPKAQTVDFSPSDFDDLKAKWNEGEDVIVAEWWRRKEVEGKVLLLSNKAVVKQEIFEEHRAELFDPFGITVESERPIKSYKICQYMMNGLEILETTEWAGQFIPVIPVYGEEVNVEGDRYFRSLIADAKDPQRVHNYMRSMSMELTALSPRVPYIGEEDVFDVDPNWKDAHKLSIPFLKYKKGRTPPSRQPLDLGSAIGVLTESRMSIDDIKAILGLYDPSLGQRSNETSGIAINARKVQGEISTFHFPDNLARSIRQVARVVLDLIPIVYSPGRIVRELGEDGTARPIQVGDPNAATPQAPAGDQPQAPGMQPQAENMDPEIYYLGKGKYDVAVSAGPSYLTRRQEAAAEMVDLIKAYPAAAPFIGDLLVKNLDWPGADEIAERLKAQAQRLMGGVPPELQATIEKGKQLIAQLTQENQALKLSQSSDAAKAKNDAYKNETDRLKALSDAVAVLQTTTMPDQPEIQQMGAQEIIDILLKTLPPAMGQAMQQMPPINVSMPPMKRVPQYNPDGSIAHTIDTPIQPNGAGMQ